MPFRSEKQRRFMWAEHPDIARRWTEEYGSAIVPTNHTERLVHKMTQKRKKKRHHKHR